MIIQSAQDLRQKLARVQKKSHNLSFSDAEHLQIILIDLCKALAQVFSDDLERVTLWNRIGTALRVAVAKSNNDIYAFVNYTLEHVKAESGKVASNIYIKQIMSNISALSDDMKRQCILYCGKYHFLIVAKARAAWQEMKGA